MSGYIIQVPSVDGATLSKNPASINEHLVISVQVTEIQRELYPVFYYSGEIYTGEG